MRPAGLPFVIKTSCKAGGYPGTRAPLTFLDWYELWLERALDPNLEQVASFGEFV
jgi:hypothetical protein